MIELDTGWLRSTPEEAVIQARVDTLGEAQQQSHEILDALRANGYEPHLRPEDITVRPSGDIPIWTLEEKGLSLPTEAS